jgi:cytochrome c1
MPLIFLMQLSSSCSSVWKGNAHHKLQSLTVTLFIKNSMYTYFNFMMNVSISCEIMHYMSTLNNPTTWVWKNKNTIFF